MSEPPAMFTSSVSRFELFRDLALAIIAMFFGRLFPTLKIPPANLTGKVAIVTGSNSGIGLEIALGLARQGSTVYLACRSISKAEQAVSQIISQVPASKGRVKSLILDTSSLDSVRAFASNWKTLDTNIDLLFHNAGLGSAPAERPLSIDGFAIVYATNFLGSFLLTYLLEPHLSPDARIILTSSLGHYTSEFSTNFSLNSVKNEAEPGFHMIASLKPHPGGTAYYQTKAMQVAFARLVQDHFDRQAADANTKRRRTAHAFNPGFVNTTFLDNIAKPSFSADPVFWFLDNSIAILGVSPGQGAATGVWLACSNDDAVVGQGRGGGYWDRMSRRVSTVDMMRKHHVERFWVRWEADAGIEWR